MGEKWKDLLYKSITKDIHNDEDANGLLDYVAEQLDKMHTNPTNSYAVPKKKRGRPKKSGSVATGYKAITVNVAANGYIVTAGSGSIEETYIFPTLDKLNEWMKNGLHPKFDHADFMEAL